MGSKTNSRPGENSRRLFYAQENKMAPLILTEAAWLEARRKYITATEMSALLGLNPYQSAQAMLRNKLDPKFFSNKYTKAGQLMEPGIIMAVNRKLGTNFETVGGHGDQKILYPASGVRIAATPDAMSSDGTLLEAKTAGRAKFDAWDSEGVPLEYEVQVRVQMLCTGYKKALIACLIRNDDFESILSNIFGQNQVDIETQWKNILTLADDCANVKIFEIEHSQSKEDLIVSEANRLWKSISDDEVFLVDRDIKNKWKDL